MKPRILLIDDQWGREDDPMIPDRYGKVPVDWLLESAEDETKIHHRASVALNRVKAEMPSLAAVLLDINFGKTGNWLGVDILKAIRLEFPTLAVLMFTSLDSDENRELVIQCMELGANEYVEKAPSAAQMEEILRVYTDPGLDVALYGNSVPIRRLRAKIARVAFSGETSVLIVGASGTGKELVARSLHRQGPHKQGPFVAKNCAHSDLHLLDSELFGHEKGAFTGAVSQRKGLIEEANGGVLFLDEIADMPNELQAKLLRTLETRSFRRVGGAQDLQSHFQLLCATNRKPTDLMQASRLREDFYYRIATMTLFVPPLCERDEDITILTDLFLKRFKTRGGASYPGDHFSDKCLTRLQAHFWPGNVRELRNVVEHAVILSSRPVIDVEELPESLLISDPATRLANQKREQPATVLPSETDDWAIARLAAELRMAVEARAHVQEYKGSQWRAEFMRMMYPECKAANAKGFDDLIKRLTQGPWGCPSWQQHSELAALIEKLRH
jgi:DNA-binding NtrC family response regulator